MSSITTIKTLRTVDIKLIPNHFFALCIGIIMLACANTCIAQETEQFKLVKNVTELQEGDIVIVVNNIVRDNGYCSALGTTLSDDKSKICGCKIEVKGEIAYATPEVDRIKLEKSGTDEWLLYSMTQQKYICNGNKGGKKIYINKLILLNKDDDSFKYMAKLGITIDNKNNNIAIIKYPHINIDKINTKNVPSPSIITPTIKTLILSDTSAVMIPATQIPLHMEGLYNSTRNILPLLSMTRTTTRNCLHPTADSRPQ